MKMQLKLSENLIFALQWHYEGEKGKGKSIKWNVPSISLPKCVIFEVFIVNAWASFSTTAREGINNFHLLTADRLQTWLS